MEGGSTLYVTSAGLTLSTEPGSVKMVESASDSGGGGGGGGNSNNTYGNMSSVPNLVFADAPHWVNISEGDYETEKEVTLQARFPDGVTADAMTFSWSFGEGDNAQTKVETIPAADAVDFIVDITGLEAGVFPVSCSISYDEGAEIIETEPDDTTVTPVSEGESWTYAIGSLANLLIETEVRGKPTVTIDGTEVTTTDDMTVNPPASYIPYEILEALEPGEHIAVVSGDGGPEEHILTIIGDEPEVGELADGGLYLIGIEADGVFYAMTNNADKSISAVETSKSAPDAAAIWTAAVDGSSLSFLNDTYYLYYSSSSVAARDKSATAWTYADGKLYYTPAGGADKGSVFYVSGVADGKFTVAKDDPDSAVEVTFIKAAAPSNIKNGTAYTYTLGIEKDLVIPTESEGQHTVTLKGGEVEYTEADGAITIGSAVIEALSTGSYTIAITDEAGMTVNHKLTVQNPPQIDVNVNVILATGVEANSLITFSDVHESWDDVGTAVKDTIIATGGKIPAVVIATGDFNNNRVAGNDSAKITGAVNEIINRVSLQLGQIDTVWVSGNHDNGYAAQYTNYNLNADLGIVLEDYASGPVDGTPVEGLTGTGVISGTGIIFDTRSEGWANNAETSKDSSGLIVIGLNYEDGNAFESNNYGDGTEESDSVYKHIKAALDSIAADYNGEMIVISSHAGGHAVGIDEDSAQSASSLSGGNSYSITNAAAIVELINSYVEEYGMEITWFFGHDHSKGEEEIVKLPGSTIISMGDSYAEDNVVENELLFTYAHAGYVGSGAAGVHNNNYTYLTWDDGKIIREERVADGNQSVRDYLEEGALHSAGSQGTISYTLSRAWELVEWTWAEDYSTAAATFHRYSTNSTVVIEADVEIESADGSSTIIATVEAPDGVEYTDTKTIEISIAGDGRTAQVSGDYQGLYVRAALVLDYKGESGLYITQCAVSSDGTIQIPRFDVPGISVTGISVALVPTLADISSADPVVCGMDVIYF